LYTITVGLAETEQEMEIRIPALLAPIPPKLNFPVLFLVVMLEALVAVVGPVKMEMAVRPVL
jgi:hypothetical protein